ncbi:MAG: DUF2062 domain-containing protein [Gammaproteobacteria bacterium]|nr:DUF2062 domain-containing protein [Gammaproteobacteria bacterium]
MSKALIRKYLPSPKKIKNLKPLRILGSSLNNPDLWKINRKSISSAAAIGLFSAYMPIPFEMLLASFLAWLFRGYLPLAIVLVWISNPFTWVLIYTPPYLFGSMILGNETISLDQITSTSMSDQLISLWLGCLIFGSSIAGSGYALSRVVWRMMVIRRWHNRQHK